jgi:hypothetical protein
MRNLVLVSVSALILGFVSSGPPAKAQTQQAAPSETTVQGANGSVQSKDRSHEGTVTVDREWKAQNGIENTGSVKPNEPHETIGRDWRAHPDK